MQTAQRYLERGLLPQALDQYKKLVKDNGNDARVLLKMGDLQAKSAAFADAVATYARAGELYLTQSSPLKAAAVFALTIELISSEAPELMDRYAHLGPRLAEIYTSLGLVNDALNAYADAARRRLVTQAYPEALEMLQRMVALDEQNPWSQVQLGEGLYEMGKATDAIAAFVRATTILEQAGRQDDALRVLERIVNLGGEIGYAKRAAQLYLDKDDPNSVRQALSKLQICFRAEPEDLDTLGLLTRAFRMLGQAKKADQVQAEIERLVSKRLGVEPEGDLPEPLDPADIKEISAITPLPASESTAQPGIATLASLEAQAAENPGPSAGMVRAARKPTPATPVAAASSAAGVVRKPTPARPVAAVGNEQRQSSPPPIPRSRRGGLSVPRPSALRPEGEETLVATPISARAATRPTVATPKADEAEKHAGFAGAAVISDDTIPEGLTVDKLEAAPAVPETPSETKPNQVIEAALPTERELSPPSAPSHSVPAVETAATPSKTDAAPEPVSTDSVIEGELAKGDLRDEAASQEHVSGEQSVAEEGLAEGDAAAQATTSQAAVPELARDDLARGSLSEEAAAPAPVAEGSLAPGATTQGAPHDDASRATPAQSSAGPGSVSAASLFDKAFERALEAKLSSSGSAPATGEHVAEQAAEQLATEPTQEAAEPTQGTGRQTDEQPGQAPEVSEDSRQPAEGSPASKEASVVVERKPGSEPKRPAAKTETPKWVQQVLGDMGAYLALRMYPRAVELLEQALERDESSAVIREQLIDVLVKSEQHTAAAAHALALARQYVASGSDDKAEAMSARALELQPELEEARALLSSFKAPTEKATGS